MQAVLPQAWANPASVHAAGRAVRQSLEQARRRVADSLAVAPLDLVWTSGGTEACHLGIRGLVATGIRHVVTTAIEHPAVAAAVASLAGAHCTVTTLPVAAGKVPSVAHLRAALGADPRQTLVALQWVNHEVGLIFPIADYAAALAPTGARFFVDATQAWGKIQCTPHAGIDALAVAAHKMGGPAGAGALWLRRQAAWSPSLLGGGQERGRRAGSPDVLACVGMGVAASLVTERLAEAERLRRMQAWLRTELGRLGATLHPPAGATVPTVVSASLPGRRGERLVAALDLEGICVASGAACSSGVQQASPVLRALYPKAPDAALSALRVSYGPETPMSDLEAFVAALRRVLARLAQ